MRKEPQPEVQIPVLEAHSRVLARIDELLREWRGRKTWGRVEILVQNGDIEVLDFGEQVKVKTDPQLRAS